MPPSYPAGSYPALVVADGATAYWRLGETSGTTASDSIGTAHGTISGGVTLGQAGALADGDKAMRFDGTTGKIATTSLTIPSVMTIEGWVNGSFDVGTRTIVGLIGYELIFAISNGRPSSYGGTFTPTFVNGASAVPPGWHHVVLVHNGVTASFYIDGVSAGSVAQTRGAQTLTGGIGAEPNGDNFFNGSLDDVAIYPTALTAPQIAAHYAAKDWKAFGPAYQDMRYRWCRYVAGQVRR